MRDEFFEPQAKHLSDDAHVICPYCKYTYQPESEDYSEETREQQCSECGKKYHLWQVFSVDHHSKPDCELNDEQHQWDYARRGKTDYQSCGVCNKWRKTPTQSSVSET